MRRQLFGATQVRKKIKVALIKDAITILFLPGVEDVAEEKAGEGGSCLFGGFCHTEHQQLNQLGRLDGKDLVLEHQ